MKKLLSLPPNVVDSFHDITGLDHQSYYCTAHPATANLGRGVARHGCCNQPLPMKPNRRRNLANGSKRKSAFCCMPADKADAYRHTLRVKKY